MKGPLQLHFAALLAAVMIAFLAAGGDWGRGAIVFVAALGVIEGVVMFLISKRLRKLREEQRMFQSSLEALPLEAARSAALAAVVRLGSAAEARVTPNGEVPSVAAELFTRYKRIVFPTGDLLELGQNEQGFISVGRAFDGARLVIRESDGALFESDGDNLVPSETRPDYPSLFHWIVKNAEP